MKELVATRVPPGDKWALVNDESDISGSLIELFISLLISLYKKSKDQIVFI